MKRTILLCSQWVDRYRPLVNALLKTGRFELYCEDAFVRNLGNRHPDLKSYTPLIPPPYGAKIEMEVSRRLAPMMQFLVEEAGRTMTEFEIYGCLQDSTGMAAELRGSLVQILYMKEAFDHIAQSIPLHLLVVDGPGIRQQTWVSAARRRKLPSLEIYHGSIHVKPELVLRDNDPPDYMAMGSALIKNIYAQLGMPEDRMRVTGLPVESAETGIEREAALKMLAQKYELNPDCKTALLYTSYDSGDAFEFLFDMTTGYQIELIRQAAAAVKRANERSGSGLQLVIKRHPTMAAAGWDDAEAYRYIAGNAGVSPIMVEPNESNPLLLAAADLVMVAKFSSTVSEAINAGKPVLMWPNGRNWLHDDLLSSGAIIFVDDQNTLDQTLHRLLLDAEYRRDLAVCREAYLQKYPHVRADEVIGRLIEYIDDIIALHHGAAEVREEDLAAILA